MLRVLGKGCRSRGFGSLGTNVFGSMNMRFLRTLHVTERHSMACCEHGMSQQQRGCIKVAKMVASFMSSRFVMQNRDTSAAFASGTVPVCPQGSLLSALPGYYP
jgi:hypothetical protein